MRSVRRRPSKLVVQVNAGATVATNTHELCRTAAEGRDCDQKCDLTRGRMPITPATCPAQRPIGISAPTGSGRPDGASVVLIFF